jgi:hypothetical protein
MVIRAASTPPSLCCALLSFDDASGDGERACARINAQTDYYQPKNDQNRIFLDFLKTAKDIRHLLWRALL